MWFIKYYKEHLFRVLKDTKNFLWDKILMSVFMLIIPGIIGSFIDNTYLGKIYMSILCGFSGLVLYSFLVLLFHLIKTPVDIYKKDKKTITSLEERQKPKLQIEFNENDPPYIDDDIIQIKGNKFCLNERLYRISIKNMSNSNTIEDVRVKLINIDECPSKYASKLPVNLKFMHDSKPYKHSVDVHPDERVFVDVVVGVMDREKQEMYMYSICSIKDKVSFRLPINEKDHRITIEAKGKDTICEPKHFMIGLKGKKIKMWEA